MLSRFSFRLILIAVATPLMVVMVHRQSLPHLISQASRPGASAPLSNASVPVCYIQLNGQIRDLRRLCGKQPLTPPPSRSVPRSMAQPEQPEAEDDDDELTPVSEFGSQTVPLPRSPTRTPTSNGSTPQPTAGAGSLQGIPDRSMNVPPPPAAPSNRPPASPSPSPPNPLAFPNPVAVPEYERRDD